MLEIGMGDHARNGSRSLPVPFWPYRTADIAGRLALPPYAGWGSRVCAHLLDAAASVCVVAVPVVAAWISGSLARSAVLGGAVAVVLGVAALGWLVANRYVRPGRNGQSLGKSALRIRLVDEQSGRAVGTGRALARDLAHVIDALSCCTGYLMPLWDRRRQTIADKITGTIVVRDAAAPPVPRR